MGILEKKLASHLNIETEEEMEEDETGLTDETMQLPGMAEEAPKKNPLKRQPKLKSAYITTQDVKEFDMVEETIGIEKYNKIMLMKIAQKAMLDHDELQELLPKVDESKAARLAEVSATCLQVASDVSKAIINHSLAKEKLELEKKKVEVRSLTINNINTNGEGGNGSVISGTQKDILDQIKNMMGSDEDDDDTPPLIEA